jgi:hypothetical protein
MDFLYILVQEAGSTILQLWYVWLPLVLLSLFLDNWQRAKRALFFKKEGSILLEFKIPKEITKSPLAMELFFNFFAQKGGEATWIDTWVKGKTRPWFSFEMVSIEGEVHLFLWTRPGFKNGIEAQLYSQFPEVELHEVPDYTEGVVYNPDIHSMWGCNIILTDPDPYPIKTYIDYGLDKDPKEEFKIDPITPMIEFLGSLGKGEQAWIQIVVRATKEANTVDKNGKPLNFDKAGTEEINSILENLKGEEGEGRRMPTEGEKDSIKAIERSMTKQPFDTGIRVLYHAQKENFSGARIGGLLGSWKQYGAIGRNGFKPSGQMLSFKYPWQDYRDVRKNIVKYKVLDAYKQRSFFYEPYRQKHFILTTEELATIFHFPGSVASTPTFSRVASRKVKAPSNLPI